MRKASQMQVREKFFLKESPRAHVPAVGSGCMPECPPAGQEWPHQTALSYLFDKFNITWLK